MDNSTLVDIDIGVGARVLAALDSGGLRIKVALWMFSSSYDDWKFVISSPELDHENPLKAYERVAVILRDQFVAMRPPILILRMKDPLIRELRNLFSSTKSVDGMRLGGQMIGNQFIQNAYVYRIK